MLVECPVATLFHKREHNPSFVLRAGCPVAAMFYKREHNPNFKLWAGCPVAAKQKI